MRLSVVIPAHNEEGSLAETVTTTAACLRAAGIEYEIVCVDDASTDATAVVIAALAEADPAVQYLLSPYRHGFGFAVRAGLEVFTGDAVAIMMADLSDSPKDLVTYHELLESGYDCAFGSRFMRDSRVSGYPWLKLLINRIVNVGLRLLFGHGYNDTTNAFKAYSRDVIDGVQPLLSQHFNLTVELPLKAIVRGHSYAVTPISWSNRVSGVSKLCLQEMGSRYLFIVLYVFFEHHLSRGDYRRPGSTPPGGWRGRWRAPSSPRDSGTRQGSPT